MWPPARFAPANLRLASYALCLCHIDPGQTSPWISSHGCLPLKVTLPFSRWSKDFPRWCISTLCPNSPPPSKRLRLCCLMCFIFMASPEIWCLTGVPSSSHAFGRHSAQGPQSVSPSSYHPESNGQSNSTGSWRPDCAVLWPRTPPSGASISYG